MCTEMNPKTKRPKNLITVILKPVKKYPKLFEAIFKIAGSRSKYQVWFDKKQNGLRLILTGF